MEKQPLLEFVTIDRETNRPEPLWEDDQAQETCPVNIPVEEWQSFLNLSLRTWESLEEDYPEDKQEERRAEMMSWLTDHRPDPITMSERLQMRLQQVREQMDRFVSENEMESDEDQGIILPKEALPMYRQFDTHQQWLAKRLETLWQPETPELKEMDRALWVAENLWQDRASPEPEIEDRLWEEAWRLETALIARYLTA
jgi:hypothetical protein